MGLLASATAGRNAARVCVVMSVFTALALTAYCVLQMREPHFDVQAFGIGTAALLFGGGGMLYLNPATGASHVG